MKDNSQVQNTSRTFGNINFDYRPLDWLSINYRIGLGESATTNDLVDELGAQPGRTNPPSGGRIENTMTNRGQVNSNLNLTVNKNIGDDLLNIKFMGGHEFYDIRFNTVSVSGSDIIIGGFHNISNTANQFNSTERNAQRVNGLFGDLTDESIVDLNRESVLDAANIDLIFQGDTEMWEKIAYALKARLYNRLSNINAGSSATNALDALAKAFTSED